MWELLSILLPSAAASCRRNPTTTCRNLVLNKYMKEFPNLTTAILTHHPKTTANVSPEHCSLAYHWASNRLRQRQNYHPIHSQWKKFMQQQHLKKKCTYSAPVHISYFEGPFTVSGHGKQNTKKLL